MFTRVYPYTNYSSSKLLTNCIQFLKKKLNKIGHPSYSSDPLSSVVIFHNFTFSKVIALGILWFNYTYVSTCTCTGTFVYLFCHVLETLRFKKLFFMFKGLFCIIEKEKIIQQTNFKCDLWSFEVRLKSRP